MFLSHYGEERGRLKEGGRGGSVWWREVVRIQYGLGVEGGVGLRRSFIKKVGNGVITCFGWIIKLDRFLYGIGLGGFLICLLIRIRRWQRCFP